MHLRSRRYRFLPASLLVVALFLCASASAQPSTLDRAPSTVLDSLRVDPNGITLNAPQVRRGAASIAAGDHIAGDVLTIGGPLDVFGAVDGNAVAVGGNVTVHRGATVKGSAIAVRGRALSDGGSVGGDLRSLSAFSSAWPRTGPPAANSRRSVSLAIGWFLVLATIGVGLSLLGRSELETVADAIRADFSRAMVFGLIGEVALLPLLVISVVALAITVIGILVIPIWVVAYVLAAAGAMAFGFVAMAYVNGSSIVPRTESGSPAMPPWQAMLVGLSVYLGLWLLSGVLASVPVLAGLIRVLVALATWVAITVGFGATLLTRGGTRTSHGAPRAPSRTAELEWQTPTPVAGVAAARRPTPATPAAPITRPGDERR